MENEIYTFKTKISKLIEGKEEKVWLAEKHGKRVEYLFKVGEEQFKLPQKIVETKQYVLLGQNIAKIEDQLRQLFIKYIESN